MKTLPLKCAQSFHSSAPREANKNATSAVYLKVRVIFSHDEFGLGFVLAVNDIHVQPSLL